MASRAHYDPFRDNRERDDLSLTHGGPFYRLLARLKLVPPMDELGSRLALWCMCLTWLPVVVLLIGEYLTEDTWDPLLTRTELHLRMLISVSLMLWGEGVLEDRARVVHRYLLDHDFIRADKKAAWRASLSQIRRARDSAAPEIALLVFVYAASALAYFGVLPAGVLRWMAPLIHEAGVHWSKATPAMWWYLLISQPLFLFLFLRWMSRWFLFAHVMWALARHPPPIQPLHADRAGGLAFLATPLIALRFYALATSTALMSVWLDELARSKARPSIFARDFILVLGASTLLAILPYLPFTRALVNAKHQGLLACSALMDRYTARFAARWYPVNETPDDAELLGHSDFSGLADLGTSFRVAEEMRVMLPGTSYLRAHLVSTVMPFLVIIVIYGPPAAEVVKALLTRLIGAGE